MGGAQSHQGASPHPKKETKVGGQSGEPEETRLAKQGGKQ